MTLDHAIKVRILASQPIPFSLYSAIFVRLATRPDPLIALIRAKRQSLQERGTFPISIS